MIALIALMACGPVGPAGRAPVVVTTDCGVEVDDQWALAHLALSPRFEIRAVVTTHAPSFRAPAAEGSARAARDLLSGLRLTRTPDVIAGSNTPLTDRKTPNPNAGVERLLKESRAGAQTDRLVVLVIGAATDVASAILTDPSFADRVKVVAMGFDRWPGGGDPWNVKNDVRAWQVLLDSRAPIVVGDGAVARRGLGMTPQKAHRLLDGAGAPGKALTLLLSEWLGAHRELVVKETGRADEWPIWDEITVAYLLGLTKVDVFPRPTLRDDLSFDHTRTRGTISWISSVQTDACWADFADCLKSKP